jgi:hypothetical protein
MKHKIVMMKKKGKKPIKFVEGGLHESTDTPQNQKIPKDKIQKALRGGYGKKAKKQANFAKNVLKKRGKKNAIKKR